MTKKIAVFTGNRAEYGLLGPILDAIASHDNLELQLVVGGAHLDPAFGRTRDEIVADGYEIAAEVPVDPMLDTARAIGTGIIETTAVLERLRPAAAMVLGDRFETFAVVVAASQSNIPMIHIEGGDKTEGGTLDDSVRHAMTKLSHIHLATNGDSAKRIAAMGEEEWRIHDVGLPVLDRVRAGHFPAPEVVASELGLDLERPVIIFTQHAIATEPDQASRQLAPSLVALERAISKHNAQVIATYPNNDDGGRAIIQDLERWASDKPDVILRQSLGRANYHGVLNLAGRVTNGACVGNSSSGLKETPAFGCPTLNIGARQTGRLAADNVLNVGYDAEEIFAALTKCMTDADFRALAANCHNPYGDGKTG
ncbi:MAG: UDP-N-acetylglucosamine 2-epimerase, partial [Boseongicola sp.]|nr:UDP-N-acetylglucosamine 2-epimerase [Boseongicola sp.]